MKRQLQLRQRRKFRKCNTKPLQKKIICRDGFSFTAQTSDIMYVCSPRDNKGPYTSVEVGYPSWEEPLLTPFQDEGEDSQVFVMVPAQIIRKIVRGHCGLRFDSGELPPLEQQDENGMLYVQ